MAATADRDTRSRDGVDFVFPVAASTKIYAGTLVCLNASSVATKGATATGLKTVGVAQEQVDNSAGLAGDKTIRVRRGVYQFANSTAADAIALADVGSSCYIVDDSTVAKTSDTSTRSVAGVVRDVDSAGVWVEI